MNLLYQNIYVRIVYRYGVRTNTMYFSWTHQVHLFLYLIVWNLLCHHIQSLRLPKVQNASALPLRKRNKIRAFYVRYIHKRKRHMNIMKCSCGVCQSNNLHHFVRTPTLKFILIYCIKRLSYFFTSYPFPIR